MTDGQTDGERARENARRADEEKAERLRNHPGIKEVKARARQKEGEERREQERREQERERARREKNEAEMGRLKAENRQRYLSSGGTEAEFEAAWPEMKAEILKRRTLEAEEETRRQTAEGYQEAW